MISKRVQGFVPSRNGFHFTNRFDKAPVFTIPVHPFGEIPVGNAERGLCGGMVFAVIDIFLQQGLVPPPDTTAPKPGTPLFQFISSRLLDSFNGVSGVFKYLEWMGFPDNDRFLGTRKSIAWHTVNDEWPAIQSDLDNGQLCPLGLVEIESDNPFELGNNHQVLAYGYDLDEDTGDLTILVYDPNSPDIDDVTLSLNLADLANPSQVIFSADPAGRGFFRTVYAVADPSVALAIPPVGPALA